MELDSYGMDVGSGCIADVPACRLQQPVDVSPRLLFWLWRQDIPLFVICRIFAQAGGVSSGLRR
jgi:hypothetical protein